MEILVQFNSILKIPLIPVSICSKLNRQKIIAMAWRWDMSQLNTIKFKIF